MGPTRLVTAVVTAILTILPVAGTAAAGPAQRGAVALDQIS